MGDDHQRCRKMNAAISFTTSSTSCWIECGCGTGVDRPVPTNRVLGRSYAHTRVVFATVGWVAVGLARRLACLARSYGDDRIWSSSGRTAFHIPA
jgi:hypothetical protein